MQDGMSAIDINHIIKKLKKKHRNEVKVFRVTIADLETKLTGSMNKTESLRITIGKLREKERKRRQKGDKHEQSTRGDDPQGSRNAANGLGTDYKKTQDFESGTEQTA